jgi:RHS repeat-associated protein
MFAIYQPGPAQTQFVHVDHLNSCVSTTNQAGTVTQDALRGPWGELYTSAPMCSWYAGVPNDILSPNLYFTPNREYASGFQRWFTPDPGGLKIVHLDDPQSWNMYAYVRNNPTTLTDPTGTTYCAIIGTGDNAMIDAPSCVSDEKFGNDPNSYSGFQQASQDVTVYVVSSSSSNESSSATIPTLQLTEWGPIISPAGPQAPTVQAQPPEQNLPLTRAQIGSCAMDPSLWPDKPSDNSNPDVARAQSPAQNPANYYTPGWSKRGPETKANPVQNPEAADPFSAGAGLLQWVNNAAVCRDQKAQ